MSEQFAKIFYQQNNDDLLDKQLNDFLSIHPSYTVSKIHYQYSYPMRREILFVVFNVDEVHSMDYHYED